MQSCPACKSGHVPLRFRLITAFGAEVRCPDCGSALVRSKKFVWVLLFSLAASGAIVLGTIYSFQLQSPVPLFLAAVLAWAASILVPVAPDQTDPIARHKTTREVLRKARGGQK